MGGGLCLSIVTYLMSPLHVLPVLCSQKCNQKIDAFRKRLLWQGGKTSHKYHLVDWDTVCLPKDQGALGVMALIEMNISQIAKWIRKLETSDGLQQRIVKNNYVKGKPISLVKKGQDDSHFWWGILETEEGFYKYCRKVVDWLVLVMGARPASGIIFGVEIVPSPIDLKDFMIYL